MAKGKNQHVVKHPGGWTVKGAGNIKATKVTRTQAQAIDKAENIARNQKSDTKIHGVDGKIPWFKNPCPFVFISGSNPFRDFRVFRG